MTVSTLAAAAAGGLLMQSETGRLALVDQWERTALAFGQPVSDAHYAAMQAWSASGWLYEAGAALAAVPGVAMLVSLVVWSVFGRGANGRTRFRGVLAVSAHAGIILAARQVVAAPIAYVRESTGSAFALGVWLPVLDESSPVARFLGMLDVFVLWWVVVLAFGMAALYGRPARRLMAAFAAGYVGLALILAAVMAVTGGTL